jgi:hypothetical protein
MKAKPIFIITLCLALGALGYFGCQAYQVIRLTSYMSAQMEAGRVVLDGLTPEKLKVWAVRSEELWAKEGRKSLGMGVYDEMGGKPMPPELKELKIIRVDVDADLIRYVWLGGYDSTSLIVKKENGELLFTAEYNVEKTQELGRVPILP